MIKKKSLKTKNRNQQATSYDRDVALALLKKRVANCPAQKKQRIDFELAR